MTTRTEKIIKYLTENLGAEELPSYNRNYRKYSNPLPDSDYSDSIISRMNGEELFFWVGVRGAVRKGRNISSSMSVTEEIFKKADAYFDSLKSLLHKAPIKPCNKRILGTTCRVNMR